MGESTGIYGGMEIASPKDIHRLRREVALREYHHLVAFETRCLVVCVHAYFRHSQHTIQEIGIIGCEFGACVVITVEANGIAICALAEYARNPPRVSPKVMGDERDAGVKVVLVHGPQHILVVEK